MGILLDSSILIYAERRRQSVLQLFERVGARFGNAPVGVSVVTVAELVRGPYRAQTEAQRLQRLAYVERLCRRLPVHPFTIHLARPLGRIEAQDVARGNVLPFEDLAIGVTALHLDLTL